MAMNSPPNDVRGFVHKRIGRGLKGFLTTGSPVAGLSGFLSTPRARVGVPQPVPVRRPPPRTQVARPSLFSALQKERGRQVKVVQAAIPLPIAARSGLCNIITEKRDPRTGQCVPRFIGTLPGIDDPIRRAEVGDAVMGRFGAALTPGSRIIDRAVCLRGMVLGSDDLCYNKRQIKNSDRMWPRGRRPLLTGGEMRAISIASRAAGRLTRTAVRLQEIGLIKKPVARKPRKKKS